MNFEKKLDILIIDMQTILGILASSQGKESKYSSEKVLIPDDEFKFNLGGSSYVAEINGIFLVCNNGHKHNHSNLNIELLCQLVDHLREKYS